MSLSHVENWGLIMFTETNLLIQEKSASIGQKHRISYVVAHEVYLARPCLCNYCCALLNLFVLHFFAMHQIAHMWFGNLGLYIGLCYNQTFHISNCISSVTMRWWDDVWLNESFATYVGNQVPDL